MEAIKEISLDGILTGLGREGGWVEIQRFLCWTCYSSFFNLACPNENRSIFSGHHNAPLVPSSSFRDLPISSIICEPAGPYQQQL